MVRVGKWNKKGISWAQNLANERFGVNSANKKIWWGTVTKPSEDGTTATIIMRGATWGGFDAIEWAIVYCTNYTGSVTATRATVHLADFSGASLFLAASLGLGSPNYVYARVYGR